jgi:hypothetical protein
VDHQRGPCAPLQGAAPPLPGLTIRFIASE